MGSCERCGRGLVAQQQRFCSKRCAGYRPLPVVKCCVSCGAEKDIAEFGMRNTGRPRSCCRACEAAYARAQDIITSRARKATAERKRRADPVIGPRIRAAQKHYHRFRGSTPEDRAWAQIIKADPCCYCRSRGGEVDHIVPTISGGADDWTNLTSACRSCNAQKNDSPMLLWIGRRILEWEAAA